MKIESVDLIVIDFYLVSIVVVGVWAGLRGHKGMVCCCMLSLVKICFIKENKI